MDRRGAGAPKRDVRLVEYRLPGGWTVLAGRSDRDNDYLSFRVAKPNDWWFHVRACDTAGNCGDTAQIRKEIVLKVRPAPGEEVTPGTPAPR